MQENIVALLKENDERNALIDDLKKEMDACEKASDAAKTQIMNFMIQEEIWHIQDLGYEERVKFIEYLARRYGPVSCQRYRDDFDRVKRYGLKCPSRTMMGNKIWVPPYKQETFYLPYHPDDRVVELVNGFESEDALVWNFSVSASEKMKLQIYRMIHYILESDSIKVTKRRYLTCLNRYYHFCVAQKIEDLELVERYQEELFYSTLHGKFEQANYRYIVGICRRELFLHSKKINWDAHVWYLEKFHLQPERLNPSGRVDKLSFLAIEDPNNRRLLKEYFRYSIGMTHATIKCLQTELSRIKQFLIGLEQESSIDVRDVSRNQIEMYLNQLRGKKLSPGTFNAYLRDLHGFFLFLQARGHISNMPFRQEYYMQKCIPYHHNRSIVPDVTKEIMRVLYKLPEDQRLMFLHLWSTGLRVSEVCTLKGNAYFRQNGDAWIQVYQIKMRSYKQIPIPGALYELMQVYIKKRQISPDAYVFRNTSDGPYRSSVFCGQMKRFFHDNDLQIGEYLFRSHDYRHGVATWFYDSGVSLQGIRDYLGHEYEEMTEQYIDFMPKRIEQANEEFFEEHNLGSYLRKGVEKYEG